MTDFLHLALPVDSQSPCGPDCEYEADFLALAQAVAGKPEQQFGDTVIAAVEPDWRAVEQMATALLAKTKDLRIVVWLAQAATRLHGVAGFAASVALMHALCQQFWSEVHPRLVVDGDDDPYLRLNAFAELSDGTGSYSGGSDIMRALRGAPLANRSLLLTVRDVEMCASNDPAARYSDAQILSILADASSGDSEAIAAFERGALSIAELARLIEGSFTSADQPDWSALKMLIKVVSAAIGRAKAAQSGDARGDGGEGAGADATAGGDVSSRTGGGGSGEVRSREDVRRALQKVCEYLERYEPSNPASLFARRAERMLGKDFIDIMRELSPDSMSHLQMITGAKDVDGA